MKILVTGIAGFVGQHLKAELCACGHEVVGIDVVRRDDSDILCDLLDYDSLKDIVSSINPCACIHLAAISRVFLRDFDSIYRINFLGTRFYLLFPLSQLFCLLARLRFMATLILQKRIL